MLVCLYFEKAFDSVDRKFMHKVLSAFGFGPDMSVDISFYKDIKSVVAVNGQLSQWFSIPCRHGDPMGSFQLDAFLLDVCQLYAAV